MKPLIGVSTWRRTLDTYYGPDTLHSLSRFYVDSVVDNGMTPVLFPGGVSPDHADRLVSMVEGVLISGGDDVDPATYGQENTASKDYASDVDRFEIALIQAARSQNKPLLGICRGIQILNVALGGTLRQEVTQPGAIHEPMTDDTMPDEWISRRHVVRFEQGSWLSDIYGASETKVNTLHHQGVGDLAPDLIVEARSDDGLIEAARCDGTWWALGVQWHPERLQDEHQSVFTALRQAALDQSSSSSTA